MWKQAKENRYRQIYLAIIARSKTRMLDKPYERHHIIPRCLGGSNDSSNIAILTPREHFICHKLLLRFIPSSKLEHAVSYMVMTSQKIRPQLRCTSHDYELARKIAAKPRSAEWKANISKALKGRPQSPETVAKMKQTLTGRKLSATHVESIRRVVKGRTHSPEAIQRIKTAKGKAYIVTDQLGVQEHIVGLKQWCQDKGIGYTSLRNTLHRDQLFYKGLKLSLSS